MAMPPALAARNGLVVLCLPTTRLNVRFDLHTSSPVQHYCLSYDDERHTIGSDAGVHRHLLSKAGMDGHINQRGRNISVS